MEWRTVGNVGTPPTLWIFWGFNFCRGRSESPIDSIETQLKKVSNGLMLDEFIVYYKCTMISNTELFLTISVVMVSVHAVHLKQGRKLARQIEIDFAGDAVVLAPLICVRLRH